MKFSKLIATAFAATLSFLLSGCYITTTNLTPARMPQNPSGIYTLSATTEIRDGSVDADSVRMDVVIDGETYPMVADESLPGVFNFDYVLPVGRDAARFYFVTQYKSEHSNEKSLHKEKTGSLNEFYLTNRYVVTMEANRAPVGTVIPVLGRGFGPSDTISMGPVVADTNYVSENIIEFTVPGLLAGQSYDVVWESGYGSIPLGKFRIDAAQISVLPESLNIRSGSARPLTFRIDSPAPPGGLPIEVTTDIPESVIMPEVIIAAGQETNTVQIQGGKIGSGSLFISIAGQGEIEVPITISE
ncbi:MAG: cell surface protein [Opitutales bacterium]|nr:cell surface protein [Opitutales bacterium]